MNQGKRVKILDFKYQKSYDKLRFLSEMAPFKYSYILWTLFGIFLIALWIGLYVGYVLPVENEFAFQETVCKTTSWKLLPAQYDQQCACRSTPCPQSLKKHPCLQIFVNYTVINSQGTEQNVKDTLLYYSEAVIGKNVSLII